MATTGPWDTNWDDYELVHDAGRAAKPAGTPQAQQSGAAQSGPWDVNWDDYEVADAPATKQNTSLAGDLATDVKRGAQQLPGALTGLADIPVAAITGRRYVSEAADALGEATGFQPGKWAEEARAEYSPQRQAADAEIEQAWEEGSAADVAGSYLRNPGKVAGIVAESLPSMLAGGVAGRAAMGVAGAAGRALSPVVAGAGGEAAIAAGQAMDQIDESVDARRAAAAAAGTGALTGALGYAGGRVAQRMGLIDPESAIAGGVAATATDRPPRGLVSRMLGGALSEGAFEELPQSVQEQMWQNWASGTDLMEGVPRSAVEGLIAGGAMGAGANVLPARRSDAGKPPVQDEAVQREVADQAAVSDAASGPLNPEAQQQLETQAPTKKDFEAALREEVEPQVILDENGRPKSTTSKYEIDLFHAEMDKRLAKQQQNIEAGRRLQAARRPSEQMGINPADGPISAAAALAVDGGATQQLAQQAAAQEPNAAASGGGQTGVNAPVDQAATRTIAGNAGGGQQAEVAPEPTRSIERMSIPLGTMEAAQRVAGRNRERTGGEWVAIPHPQQDGRFVAALVAPESNQAAAQQAQPTRAMPLTETGAKRASERWSRERGEPYTVAPHPTVAGRFTAVPAAQIQGAENGASPDDRTDAVVAAPSGAQAGSDLGRGTGPALPLGDASSLDGVEPPARGFVSGEQSAVAVGGQGGGRTAVAPPDAGSPLGQALRILLDRTDGNGSPDGLAGPEHAQARTEIVAALTGQSVAEIEAAPNYKFRTSVPQVERLLYDAAGIQSGNLAARRAPFLDWLDAQTGQSAPTVEPSEDSDLQFSRTGRRIDRANQRTALFTALAQFDDAFQQPTPQAKTVEEIAREIDPAYRAKAMPEMLARDKTKGRANKVWEISVPKSNVRVGYLFEDPRGRVWIDVSRLIPDVDTGNKIYGIAAGYAHNTGKVFIGDPEGLSPTALFRRLENMISSALRYGTTDHLYPHAAQVDPAGYYGEQYPDFAKEVRGLGLDWKEGDFAHNLTEMLRVSYNSAVRYAPKIKDIVYDFDSRQFVDAASGERRDRRGFRELLGRNGSEAPTRYRGGSATLARAALVNTLLRGQGKEAWRNAVDHVGAQLRGRGLDVELREIFYSRDAASPRPPSGVTADSLTAAFSERFPRLAPSLRTMLERGRRGEKGGVVMIDSSDPAAMARSFASKTGRSMDEAVRMFRSEGSGDVQGFYDPRSGLTFLIGPNLDAQAAPAVLLHEMTHGQQRERIDARALELVESRASKAPELRAFLDRVADRMADAGEAGNASEATAYIVEQAVLEGRSAGFTAADSKLANWIDTHIGKPVGNLVRAFILAVRGWMVRHGLPSNTPITVDDLVSYALAGVERAAQGDVRTRQRGGVAQSVGGRMARSPSSITAAWEAPEPSKLFGRFDKDSLIYTLQNKQIDMKRVVEAVSAKIGQIADDWNPYLQEELFHGRSAKGVQDFLTKEMRPLLARMRMNKVEMAELERYLHARHAPEANAHIAKINPNEPDLQDGGSGMTNKEAADHIASITPERRAVLDALANQVDAINANTRKLLVDTGLETAETVKAWEAAYKHYVPLQREDAEAGGMGIGQGFSVRGSASKRRTGSKKAVVDILANIALQRERTIVRIEKNRVAQANYALALKAPNPDFWMPVNPDEAKAMTPAQREKMANELVGMGLDPADAQNFVKEPVQRYVDPRTGLVAERINPVLRGADNVLAVRVEGKDRFVFFNRKDERAQRMVHALKNLDADQLGRLLQVSSKLTRWFASVNTQYNPIFGVVNMTRDVQAALLQLSTTPIRGSEKAVLGNVWPAMKGIYAALRAERSDKAAPGNEWAKLFDEFQNEGGRTGYRDQFSNSQARAEALQRELNPEGWMDGPLGKVFTANGNLKVPMAQAQKLASGLFGWLTDYNDMMENGVRLAAYKAAKDKGMTKQQAASVAKNLTVNFNRKGQIATQAGALYAFFNAAMQGTARMVQTLAGPAGKKIMLGGLTLGALQAVTLTLAGFDDDEPPEFVRERSIIIPVGGGKYVSIPMPLGFHVIPSTSRILTEWALGGFKDTTKRFGDFMALFADTFNPIGNAGWSIQTIAPSAVDPLAALAENRDWTGKPIAREDFNSLRPTPGYSRAKDTASELSKAIAYWANLATGGTDYKPGLISPTPDQIDYLIGQFTGGVGREYLKAEQTATSLWTGEELPAHKIPLLGRFYGDTAGQSAEGTRFYNNLREINLHRAEIEGRRRDRQDVSGYLRENPAARLGLWGPPKVENQVRKLREAKRDALEKGQTGRVKMLDARITALMKQFNERVAALEGA